MPAYELSFDVVGISDVQEERIQRRFDIIVLERYGRRRVTMLVPGVDVAVAFDAARAELDSAGVQEYDFAPDYATRAEVARRAGLSTQAVGQYVRGERGDGEFPMPALHVPAEVWVWGDVVPWLQRQGVALEPGVVHPTSGQVKALQYRAWSSPATQWRFAHELGEAVGSQAG